jgi:hypothetical protein
LITSRRFQIPKSGVARVRFPVTEFFFFGLCPSFFFGGQKNPASSAAQDRQGGYRFEKETIADNETLNSEFAVMKPV